MLTNYEFIMVQREPIRDLETGVTTNQKKGKGIECAKLVSLGCPLRKKKNMSNNSKKNTKGKKIRPTEETKKLTVELLSFYLFIFIVIVAVVDIAGVTSCRQRSEAKPSLSVHSK